MGRDLFFYEKFIEKYEGSPSNLLNNSYTYQLWCLKIYKE